MTKANIDVVLDCANPQKLGQFWAAALGYRVLGSADQWLALVPTQGTKPPLVLQGVPEPKAGKNRAHIDIVTDDVEGEATRLEALGATRLGGVLEEHGNRWIPMADPEGNEFCVCLGIEW